jgi:hypothetical protein
VLPLTDEELARLDGLLETARPAFAGETPPSIFDVIGRAVDEVRALRTELAATREAAEVAQAVAADVAAEAERRIGELLAECDALRAEVSRG